MFLVDTLMLLTGLLLLIGIASSKFSARFGVPVLVLFLLVGMLAGSDGIGKIHFEDYQLTHAVGTVALAIILFDGGLRTTISSVKLVWKHASVMATLGVFITSGITGIAASWVLGISWIEGLLLGSIVGSTDASAVFSVLRSGGVSLSDRMTSTLEFESGSNDPMAIFLTVGLIEVITGQMNFGPALFGLFLMQMGVGAAVGLLFGVAAKWLVNHINLDSPGMYPILVTACGILSFGLAAALDGSGFLAIYMTGIMLGNSRMVFKRGIFLFHDAAAWLAQIIMFVVLGLLSYPSELIKVSGQGLLIAVVLIFLARPIAVWLSVWPFQFNWREKVFLSWVGLKGAVPITLAIYPLLFGVDNAMLLFNVVFFVVVLSALVQGWTLPQVAKALKLEVPSKPVPPLTLEISSLKQVDSDVIDFTVNEHSRAAGCLVRDLALPDGVVIALIAREQQVIPPQGNTRIEAGDHAILVVRPETRPLVESIFCPTRKPAEHLPNSLEFPLRASIKVEELESFYGISLQVPKHVTLAHALREKIQPKTPQIGDCCVFGPIALYVRALDPQGEIDRVGMVILPDELNTL